MSTIDLRITFTTSEGHTVTLSQHKPTIIMTIQFYSTTSKTDLSMGTRANVRFFEEQLPALLTSLAIANVPFSYDPVNRTVQVADAHQFEADMAMQENNISGQVRSW